MKTNKQGVTGLRPRTRADGTVWYWIAHRRAVKLGYEPKTVLVWRGDNPSDTDRAVMNAERDRLQANMTAWLAERTKGPAAFDGTLACVIDIYKTDLVSPYHRKDSAGTKPGYDHDMKILRADLGARRLDTITGKDILRWYNTYRKGATFIDDKGHEQIGPERIRRAHGLMSMLRIVLGFGAAAEIENCPNDRLSQCKRLCNAMAEMRFEHAQRRTKRLELAHVMAIRATAHEAGLHSIALETVLQFDLGTRQGDVIGKWMKISAPGVSTITDRGQKWIKGFRWEEISADLILTHKTNKRGQVLEFDLRDYPMVMEELERYRDPQTGNLPASGPIIVSEATGLPYRKRYFAGEWRKVATKAGVPTDVWNMDAKAGALTEGHNSRADIDDLRINASHTTASITAIYTDRASLPSTKRVAKARYASREQAQNAEGERRANVSNEGGR